MSAPKLKKQINKRINQNFKGKRIWCNIKNMFSIFRLLAIFPFFLCLKASGQDIDGTYVLVPNESPIVQSRANRTIYQFERLLKKHSEGKELRKYEWDALKKFGLYSEEKGFETDQNIIEQTLYDETVKQILAKKGQYQFHTIQIVDNKFTYAAPDTTGSATPELCTISILNKTDGVICEGNRNLVGSIFYDDQKQSFTFQIHGGETVYKLK